MKSTQFKILIILLAFLGCSKACGQINEEAGGFRSRNANAVYGTVGLALTGNYERMLWAAEEKAFFTSAWFKVGYGLWEEPFGGRGRLFSMGINALTGSNNNHVEVGLGFASMYDELGYDLSNQFNPSKSDYRDLILVPTLGYRYQKPDGILIFRFGLSRPEILYLSLGVCF